MNIETINFIDHYVRKIENHTAALFIGAGFSKPAGYVDWKGLLSNMAEELGLDINKEDDLVSLAQYYCNKRKNRAIINDTIMDEFSKEKDSGENHRIIAQLPISTYWTTNYDSLIENALKGANRIVDIKSSNKDFFKATRHWDAIVYKMHGDISDPNEAIIIKDDYERYYRDHSPFINALTNDLITKTFLFIGFSFKDPNISYVLSRVRIEYIGSNSMQHYAIMRSICEDDYNVEDYEDEEAKKKAFEYDKCKQDLFLKDLERYNILPVMIDEYHEITDILNEIGKRLNRNNVFITGSAHTYDPYEKNDAMEMIRLLSGKLIVHGCNIISGFGLGVGSDVISGALTEIYKSKSTSTDRLILRPFPQNIQDENERIVMLKKYRDDMISCASASIFLFGNKREEKDGSECVVNANGVLDEFNIAKEKHNLLVPVGCTGYVAKELWEQINNHFNQYYLVINGTPREEKVLKDAFNKLNEKTDNVTLVDNIIAFIKLFDYKKYRPV